MDGGCKPPVANGVTLGDGLFWSVICKPSAPTNYEGWDDVNHKCIACHGNCDGCLGETINDCTGCQDPNADPVPLAKGPCTCGVGWFPITTDPLLCGSCHNDCAECTSSTAASNCQVCYANATLSGGPPGNCICNLGYFPNTHAGNCSQCNVACKTCSGSGVN
jgi:hypothetical protein